MPFHTPGGLKIRLDEEGIIRVLAASGLRFDLDDAYMDAELWANLPRAMSMVGGLTTAMLTHSAGWTILVAFGAFCFSDIFQQFTYSKLLNVVFPQFLGSWMIVTLATIVIVFLLGSAGAVGAAVAVVLIVGLGLTGVADIFLGLLLPLRIWLRRLRDPPIGDIEMAFIAILNRQARAQEGQLDWSNYDRTLD